MQKTGGILSNGQTATPNRPENYFGFGMIVGDFEPLSQCLGPDLPCPVCLFVCLFDVCLIDVCCVLFVVCCLLYVVCLLLIGLVVVLAMCVLLLRCCLLWFVIVFMIVVYCHCCLVVLSFVVVFDDA